MTLKFPHDKSAATAAWLSVVRAYNLCDAAMATRLSALGLRVGEHEVLANLLHSPGLTQQEVAKRCFVAKSGISMMITRMETQGLLRREPDPNDGRFKRLFLSDTGEPLARQSMAIQDEIVGLMMGALTPKELADMTAIGARVAQALETLAD
jgi:DNA-binding MarR family transcriptional regulator